MRAWRRDSARLPSARQTTHASPQRQKAEMTPMVAAPSERRRMEPSMTQRSAMGEVERGAVAGDLGHPESRIARIAVDDAVPALQPAESSRTLQLPVHRLQRRGRPRRSEHDDPDPQGKDLTG